jgi:hypothetical protein
MYNLKIVSEVFSNRYSVSGLPNTDYRILSEEMFKHQLAIVCL